MHTQHPLKPKCDRQTDKQTIYAELQPSTPLLPHLNTTIHNCWMHSWFNSMHACFFFFFVVCRPFFFLFSKLTFSKKSSVIPSGSQTVWIQIRPKSMHQILQREAMYCKNSYIYSLTFNYYVKIHIVQFQCTVWSCMQSLFFFIWQPLPPWQAAMDLPENKQWCRPYSESYHFVLTLLVNI